MTLRTTATPARPGPGMGHRTRAIPAAGLASFANPFIKWLLRSPLHRVSSKDLMLITFAGRKSGRAITTPVSYYREGDTITLFTRGVWWKNLQGGAPVTLLVRGHGVSGAAETFTGIEDVVRGVTAYIRIKGVKNAWRIRVALDSHRWPTADDLVAAAQGLVMVQVRAIPAPGA